MKIAYFDCFAGISGDMTLAAFVDSGLSVSLLRRELRRLKIKGYRLDFKKTVKNNISCTRMNVVLDDSASGVHHHRTLKDILALIDRPGLKSRTKDIARQIFINLAEEESKVHNVSKYKLHFHEIGDIDSIIDIVGTAIAVTELGIDKVYASKINLSRGFVHTEHGRYPTPAPITTGMLKGVPVTFTELGYENVTPTGAAIIKTLAESFGEEVPHFMIETIGYGAGQKTLEEVPNILRIMIGEDKKAGLIKDTIITLEAEIDDMNPVGLGYVINRLLKEGALDAYMTPVYMKKGRPGVLLTVLLEKIKINRIASVIFDETTTIGVRYYQSDRLKLERKTVPVSTRYGRVNVKAVYEGSRISRGAPEFDDCARIADKRKKPLLRIYEEAKRAFFDKYGL